MTDILIVAQGINMPSIYITGVINDGELTALKDFFPTKGTVIFGGSRHRSLREDILSYFQLNKQLRIVFSPSYSIYEHSKTEIVEFLSVANIVVVNEHEAEYLRQTFCLNSVDEVMALTKEGGVVTLGPRGADIYKKGSARARVASRSGREDDVVGAGEAFLCGFMYRLIEGGSWTEAGEIGCAVAAQMVVDGRIRASIDITRLPRLAN